jgi:hypothetical protein
MMQKNNQKQRHIERSEISPKVGSSPLKVTSLKRSLAMNYSWFKKPSNDVEDLAAVLLVGDFSPR